MLKRLPATLALLCTVTVTVLVPAQAQTQTPSPQAAPSPARPQAGPALPRGVQRVTSVEGITEYRLANGLQVLLAPDSSKPTTTVNLTYRVGSRHENYGETGMAHLLEHLIFKGTPTTRNALAEFTRRGMRANGTTWFDRTNYFASFSANEENLRWYLSWQADAMVNSFIAKKDLETEMTVVRNEMERGENNPGSILFQRALASMYQWHNYGNSTIGARADVENVDIGRLQAFYRTYYQPDNATLIVAGAFEPAQVLQWVQQYFGRIPAPKRELPELYTIDPVQDGERTVTLRRVGGTPLVMAGYHVMPGAHPDYAAIEALEPILTDAPAGRLHQRLVEAGLASSVFAFSRPLADPGFLMAGVELGPGQDLARAREVLLGTLESFEKEPVTPAELQRARVRWINAWEQLYADPESLGVALSESVAQGDWRLFFLLRDRMRALKAEDVQRVATQRFVPSNRTLATYLPTEAPQRAPAPQRVDVAEQLRDFKPQEGAGQVAAFVATPANIDRLTQRFVIEHQNRGGLEVALLPKPTRGSLVQATLVLRFGDEKSLFGSGDAASMLAQMLDKGTRRLSRQQIRDRLDELQTEMGIGGSPGALQVSLTTRRQHLPAVIELLGELLREPALPPDALEEVRRQMLTAVEQQRKEPEAQVANGLARHGNPYPRGDVRHARTFDEIEADLKAVTVQGLSQYHQRFLGASHAQFGAVGDLDVSATREALQKAFGNWASPLPFTRVPAPFVEVPPTRMVFETPDKQNATLGVRLSVPLNDLHPDYPALMMANWLLGAGGDSRLWKRIREQGGLSYDVRSSMQWNSFEPNSQWSGSAIFAPSNRAKVEAAFREVVEGALKGGFTAEELAAGKRGLLSRRALSRAQDDTLAGALASNLFLNRDFSVSQRVDEALQALTVEQVNAALRKYVNPSQFVTAVGGDFKP
ncbi:M16 family metallopeptidase [Caldimonas tepidiphila]|uniref:M16 family metallopeptidase n=1 Tax=Caldimonas tepidiphila TaxID=2315841 RepID=UPI000E5B699F|nr:pitrilysin family protein [Caldimonas tepidiphila]